MNANDRIPDALQDFEGYLFDGLSVDEALVSAAKDHDLKPDVLKYRAEKALGDLKLFAASRYRTIELTAERHEIFSPLRTLIDHLYANGKPKGLTFIPINNFVLQHYSDPIIRDEAIKFARTYQKTVIFHAPNK